MCLAMALLLASPALAQTAGNTAAAEALFQEAQQLYAAGKVKEACPKFEASYRLDPGLGTLLNVARCHEAVGNTASAWSAYIDLAPLALRAGQHDRAAIANKRIAVLEPRLMRVLVRVESARDDMELLLDAAPLDTALIGTAVAVDPGEHRLEVRAPGHESWSKTIILTEEGVTTEVAVPALVAIDVEPPVPAPAPAPVKPVPMSPAVEPAPVAPVDRDTSLPVWMIAGGSVAGAGLVLLAVGGGFTADAASAWKEADCTGGRCASAEAQGLSEQAGRSADAATGLVVAGGVVAAAGLVMFIVGVTDEPSASTSLTRDGLRLEF
jgi:hypothetical protein